MDVNDKSGEIFLGGAGGKLVYLPASSATRHGLVTGATGTGKTTTLQILAEGFAQCGISVFAADMCGDLACLAERGEATERLVHRANQIGTKYVADKYSTIFWDIFAEHGHPIRTTVDNLGPAKLSQLLNLDQLQTGVLHDAFRAANELGVQLLDMTDLRSILSNLAYTAPTDGTFLKKSLAKILDQLTSLEREGLDAFISDPQLDLNDLIRTDSRGRGYVNVLVAHKLALRPRIYVPLMIWMLSELCEILPRLGENPLPKLVFFFDEAHHLPRCASAAFLRRLPQLLVSLRHRGVGVFFVTSTTADLPNCILEQLGNLIHHGQHSLTEGERRARSFTDLERQHPSRTLQAVELQLGEASVSLIREDQTPSSFEQVYLRPPRSRLGSITPDERRAVMAESPLKAKYQTPIDRSTAYQLEENLTAATALENKSVGRLDNMSAILRSMIRRALSRGN